MQFRLPRSLIFWFGFFGLVSGAWLWADSAFYSTGISWPVTSRRSFSIHQSGGELTLEHRNRGTGTLPSASGAPGLTGWRTWNRHRRFVADFWDYSHVPSRANGGAAGSSSSAWSVSHWMLMILYCLSWLAAIVARWFRDCLVLADLDQVERDKVPLRPLPQKGVRIRLRPVVSNSHQPDSR